MSNPESAQNTERIANPEAFRAKAREFAHTEEEIMRVVKSLPVPKAGSDNTYIDVLETGVSIFGDQYSPTPTSVGMYTDEAEIPFDPQVIEGFILSPQEPREYGVNAKYVLSFDAWTDPKEPTLFPEESSSKVGYTHNCYFHYYFDEDGNYLKEIITFGPELNLEELRPSTVVIPEMPIKEQLILAERVLSGILGKEIDLKVDQTPQEELDDLARNHSLPEMRTRSYKAEMTPEDFELVGKALSLFRENLSGVTSVNQ